MRPAVASLSCGALDAVVRGPVREISQFAPADPRTSPVQVTSASVQMTPTSVQVTGREEDGYHRPRVRSGTADETETGVRASRRSRQQRLRRYVAREEVEFTNDAVKCSRDAKM